MRSLVASMRVVVDVRSVLLQLVLKGFSVNLPLGYSGETFPREGGHHASDSKVTKFLTLLPGPNQTVLRAMALLGSWKIYVSAFGIHQQIRGPHNLVPVLTFRTDTVLILRLNIYTASWGCVIYHPSRNKVFQLYHNTGDYPSWHDHFREEGAL